MTTRDRSGCRSVVAKSSIRETSPRTVRSSMYSPTRKGLVKMIVRPATRLPSTPCNAKPTPRPATPIPATSGAIWKPNLSSATTAAKSMTRTRRSSRADDDALAEPAEGGDAPAGGRRERWIDGPEQEGAREAHTIQPRPGDARLEGLDVDRDIGQLRHLVI